MAGYVDGFLIAVPTARMETYTQMAQLGKKIWLKYGALEYCECKGDDVEGNEVNTSFPSLLNAGRDETIIFSYILFRDRKHRDEVNAKVMKDPEMTVPNEGMPFEMKRMSYGGFVPFVSGKK
ncbi:MAG: DUF1428 domain-containing protein [Nanoarchaeota archaeon]|nr:DUF1428 domain-containing protein [Nanoarchaeota archaeon]